jgi:RNA polymerase sigma factor (sigma-70 family)
MTGVLPLLPDAGDSDVADATADAVLARAAAEGDRRAFAEIYDRYADRLYDFCIGLLGDRDAAADCVQDAFCVAATDLGGLRDPDKLRPWLYSIARHHAMRRLRHRYREEVSDELPDMISHEASPETIAGQSELARLVAEAAGGLSDRDRELLDLSYRHGLDGPELAEALGVTLTSANTMMFRLRQTVERCLGALLVARGAQANPSACPELAVILKGWDGQFSVLMRKRMARHIDACDTCEQDQRQQVNPVALLGSAAVFIPAPASLRRQTLDRVQLTSASSSMVEASGPSARSGSAEISGPSAGSRLAGKRRMALVAGIPLLCLGLTIPLFPRQEDPVSRVVDTGTDSSEGPRAVVPAAVKGAPTPARQKPAQSAGIAGQSVPTQRAQTPAGGNTPGTAGTPGPTPEPDNSGLAPDIMLPNTGPDTAPAPAQIYSEPAPDSDAKTTTIDSQGAIETADTETADTETVSSPTGTDPIDSAPKGPANLGPLPNPNLNTKITSPLPKTNTVTIPNLKDTTFDLPAKTPPKSDTTTGSGGGTTGGTKPGSGTTSGGTGSGTKPGSGTTSGGGTGSGSGNGSGSGSGTKTNGTNGGTGTSGTTSGSGTSTNGTTSGAK